MNETVPASLAGERIDRVVAVLTGMPRSAIAGFVTDGRVRIDGEVVKTRSAKVVEGQQVDVDLPDVLDTSPVSEEGIVFDLLYSDADVIVVDKPAGLVVHPGSGHNTGTLVHGLLEQFPDMATTRPGNPMRPGIVHRLDAGTSGLLVIGRSVAAYDALVAMMKNREVGRRYLTLVWGDVRPDVGMIDAPIGRSETDRTKMAVASSGRVARTRYEVLDRHADPDVSLVAAQLETGRTHQIRVHFAAIGHPVVGDRRYRGIRQGLEMGRPFLHARSLNFNHPITGKAMSFESPIPADLRDVMTHLGLETSGK